MKGVELFNGMDSIFRRMFEEKGDGKRDYYWQPPVDVFENDESIILLIELPGIKKEAVSINIEKNLLSVVANKEDLEKDDSDKISMKEILRGKFKRDFVVPSGVEREKIEAEFKNGILKLTLPKKEEAKPREIEISIG